jgi:hypothetical protein
VFAAGTTGGVADAAALSIAGRFSAISVAGAGEAGGVATGEGAGGVGAGDDGASAAGGGSRRMINRDAIPPAFAAAVVAGDGRSLRLSSPALSAARFAAVPLALD